MKKAIRDVQNSNKIMEILRQEHIIIPPDFAENLIMNAQRYYEGKLPPKKSIYAVIKMCNYWKTFCMNDEEFSKLVCAKIYSMVRLHGAVVTSNSQDDTCYVGRICALRKDVELPELLTISATYGGTIKKQGRFAGTIVEF